MSATFSALKVYNYRLYFSASLISNTGTWMQRVAQDWFVLNNLNGGGVALGITTGLQFLPFVLVTPFAGVLADRFPKRRLMSITQMIMAIPALIMGILILSGAIQLWHVYLLAFVAGIGAAIDNPVRQSFVVEIVGREHLTNAVALNSGAFNGARFLGPTLAGFLILLVGAGWVFIINVVSFGAVFAALWKMHGEELDLAPPVARGPGLMREGLRYVRNRPDIMAVLVSIFAVGTFAMNFQMTSALMATEVFHKNAGEYGILGSILALGSLMGALLAARRQVVRMRLVLASAAIFCVIVVIVGLMPTYWTFAALLIPLGLVSITFVTSANAIVQLSVSPHLRGRVMALYMTVFLGGTPIGAPIVGWIGEAFGARWTLVGGGALALVGVVIAALMLFRRSGMTVRTTFRPWPRLELAAASVTDRAP